MPRSIPTAFLFAAITLPVGLPQLESRCRTGLLDTATTRPRGLQQPHLGQCKRAAAVLSLFLIGGTRDGGGLPLVEPAASEVFKVKATVPGLRGCLATNRILARKFQKIHIQPIQIISHLCMVSQMIIAMITTT